MFEKFRNLFGSRRGGRLLFTAKEKASAGISKTGTAAGEKSSSSGKYVGASSAGRASWQRTDPDTSYEPALYGAVESAGSHHSASHCSSSHDSGSSSSSSSSCDSSSSSSSSSSD